jgi:muconolactone delta-isomerase
MIETSVIPSLESMANLEKEGKIVAGGLYAGARVGVAIVNAKSNEEVSQILRSFPFWGLLEWTVTPLETFNDGVKENHEMLKQLKSLSK